MKNGHGSFETSTYQYKGEWLNNYREGNGIIIEDKTNPEKNISHEFKNNEIFKASDTMVDALTALIAKKREKNTN